MKSSSTKPKTILQSVLIATVLVWAFSSCESNSQNQTTTYQPKQEIQGTSQSESPEKEAARTVAYQFVMGVVNENYIEVAEWMSLEYFFKLMPVLMDEGIDSLFSTEYTHKIVDMRPVVAMGYEVVATDIQSIDSKSFFGESSKYKNASAFKVSFDCADANSKFYDNSKGEYDTSVTVIVVKEDGVWKVWDFD